MNELLKGRTGENVKKGLAALLALLFLLGSGAPVGAVPDHKLDAAIEDTASYVYRTVKNPQVGSVGGEWAVLGLARAGCNVPEQYYRDYYATVEAYVRACKGVLHEKKYTEYSRLNVALTAIGKDPRSVADYNLLTPLGDFKKTIWQGINGPIWALIALDSGGYPMPQNPTAAVQATRDMYVDEILSRQLTDGGFSLFGGTAYATPGDAVSDPDITGMALQALAKYQHRADVRKVTGEALDCMSKKQGSQGGFTSWGISNSEGVVQMIAALAELGIPLDDPRFVKNGHTMLENLLTFYLPGQGFLHTADGSGSNQMATEQGFYGLVAARRLRDGKNSLYRMNDALRIPDAVSEVPVAAGIGLADKHPDIRIVPLAEPGKTFADISAHQDQPAIEALAARRIMAGRSAGLFEPEAAMTRAEFAAVMVKALGLMYKETQAFADVLPGSWYAGAVGTAHAYGLVGGVGGANFNPEGTITRQEAAAIVTRAARLCGLDTAMDSGAVRDLLAQFPDYVAAADWARPSLAFCYREDLLSQDDLEIRSQEAIKRCEIAQTLFRLLGTVKLL